MDGEYDQLQGDTVEMDSSLDLKLGAFYQYRPVHEFMLTFGVLATRVGEVDGNDGTGDYKVTDHMDAEFSFNAKYLITHNFIAKFLFTIDRRDDFDYEKDLVDVEVDKRLAEKFGLGVDFLF